MLGRHKATTAIQTEMPNVSRIIHNLRRRTRSKYSRICALMPASPEAVGVGCSFKDLPPNCWPISQKISDSTLLASYLPEIRYRTLLSKNINVLFSSSYGHVTRP